jgi:hypothetical protein
MTDAIITVRYVSCTYLARMKGCKKTASCVYSAKLAAQSLAKKLGFDASLMVQVEGGPDYSVFGFDDSEATV